MAADPKTRDVSIVIPNWNGLDLLQDYFDSTIAAACFYSDATGADVEVIVVDDASTDGGREWLRENCAGNEIVRVVELETNVGFLRAVNHGFAEARYPIVFLLNNDVQVEPDSILPLTGHFTDENVFAVSCRGDRIQSGRLDGGGKIGTFEKGYWRVFLNYEIAPGTLADDASDYYSFYGPGGYTAYDREKLARMGGFQDCLAPFYWEDVEIGYRAWKRGWVVKYEPRSSVHHLGSATTGKEELRENVAIVTERNRLLMTWINLHDRRWMASHLLWLLVKSVGAVAAFRWIFLRSLFGALGRLPDVRHARLRERRAAKITDRELAARFRGIAQDKNIFIVHDLEDEKRLEDLKKDFTLTSEPGIMDSAAVNDAAAGSK